MHKITRRLIMKASAALAGSVFYKSAFALSDFPASDFVARHIGKKASAFSYKITPSATPFYDVSVKNGKALIEGSDDIALCKGAYKFLSDNGILHTSWEGDNLNFPAILPDYQSGKIQTQFTNRAYLNVCAYGYTTPYWDWARWEKEIDFMASRGINMPLAMEGQEYVWRLLWQEEGISDQELDAYFCGPPFLPWARMGNIESYFGNTPHSYHIKKRDIQIKILKRMRELGMSPILPAFAGYVPKAWAQKYKSAEAMQMVPWGGFHETWWLNPNDGNFARLAKRFLELYTKIYGEGEYYLADSFNEMRPPVKDGEDKNQVLKAYGKKLFDSINHAKPNATWVMQGWLFEFEPDYWTPDSVRAYLEAVPDDKVMVLDIGNDYTRDTWRNDKAFYGKKWIFGYIHNFGGNNALFGDFELYEKDLDGLKNDPTRGNLAGFGVFPEGLNTNSIAYDYMFEMAWKQSSEDFESFLSNYCRARYSKTDDRLEAAWKELIEACYQTHNWKRAWWRGGFGTYLFMKKPRSDLWDYDGPQYDVGKIKTALAGFVLVFDKYKNSQLFIHDFVNAVRHWGLLNIDNELIKATQAGRDKNIAQIDASIAKISDMAIRLEEISAYVGQSLDNWRKEARAFGDSKLEKDYYEKSAITQVTVWGGDNVLDDYASKAWHGLIKDYYLPRWQKLFSQLKKDIALGVKFDAEKFKLAINKWDHEWINTPPDIQEQKKGLEIRSINQILAIF
jgi:alpha-N-acetylglucosaminidase